VSIAAIAYDTSSSAGGEVHPLVHRYHFDSRSISAEGRFDVRRGRGLLNELASWLFGLPPAARGVPFTLHIDRSHARDVWRRNFDGRRLDAEFWHEGDGTICERFGPMRLHYRTMIVDGELRLLPGRTALCVGPIAVRLPAFLSPRVKARARASADGTRLHACIVVFSPLGLLVAYRGWVREVTR
jgi:hypothetical protein